MIKQVENHLDILGRTVEDKVTGAKGVATSISFDLYGCIQVVLQPTIKNKTLKVDDARWYDIRRLDVIDTRSRVMDPPNFDEGFIAEGKKGSADKPIP